VPIFSRRREPSGLADAPIGRGISRRSLLARLSATTGAAFAYLASGSRPGLVVASHCTGCAACHGTANNCKHVYCDREIPKGPGCRVLWGPPSQCVSQVTAYSPDDDFYITCRATCQSCPCNFYFQARAAACNDGNCSCTWRAV
jgi:hypothetical protein